MQEPIWVQEYEIHEEVDGQQTAKFNTPFCPSCLTELEEADRCSCGEWKNKRDDWCAECVVIRDDAVQRCINQIRTEKKLALSTKQIKDLMLTYFG